MDNACKQIKKIANNIGVKFITVDAYCHSRGFYLKSSFDYININNPKKAKRIAEKNSKKTILMFKQIDRL
ncbi:MAG: hypothetical protein K6A34_04135 [Methanobrevibacter sp.]|nr:hypothetical protein [Methanobrevibacter sp.]